MRTSAVNLCVRVQVTVTLTVAVHLVCSILQAFLALKVWRPTLHFTFGLLIFPLVLALLTNLACFPFSIFLLLEAASTVICVAGERGAIDLRACKRIWVTPEEPIETAIQENITTGVERGQRVNSRDRKGASRRISGFVVNTVDVGQTRGTAMFEVANKSPDPCTAAVSTNIRPMRRRERQPC
jgi:hypothetical protein